MSQHPKKKGKKKPKERFRIMKELRIDEISLVDFPMQDPARVAILKRACHNQPDLVKRLPIRKPGEAQAAFIARFMSDPKVRKEFPDQKQRRVIAGRQFGKRIALTMSTDGHAHSILTDSQGGEARVGSTSFVDGHQHDWVMDQADNITVADVEGHAHGIAMLVMKGGEEILDELLPEEDALASLPTPGLDKASTGKAATPTSGTEKNMTPEEKAEFEKAAKEDLDKVTKRAERAESILELSPDQRAHFDELDESSKDEFLAKPSDERTAIVKNLADANSIVYTSPDGEEFRKSDDSRMVKLAQDRDADRKTLAAERAVTKRSEFEKRASEDLPNLPGENGAKADLLEAVASIPADKQEPVLAILKAHDAGLAKAFVRVGVQGHDAEGAAPGDQIETMAKAVAAKDSITLEQAYTKVLETPEGKALYSAHAGH